MEPPNGICDQGRFTVDCAIHFAGINQTIMLSLAMIVVASLIGAKGLGEDVLEALQYSSVGQGILAGFAILFCAMILNRVIQDHRD